LVAFEERGGQPAALALDGDRLMFPTDLNGDVDVVYLSPDSATSRCGKVGPNGESLYVACQRAARGQGSLLVDQIVALPNRVLWADGPSLKSSPTAPSASPRNDVVGSSPLDSITGFAANPMVAYFSTSAPDQNPSGVILRAVVGGDGTSVRIARGQRAPRVGAIDNARVYWSTSDCAIMAMGL
jgi:hypothetical protein